MRILLLGTFVVGSLENFYYEGIIRAGHEVKTIECVSEYYAAINKNLFNKCLNNVNSAILLKKINNNILLLLKNTHFDVIMVFKGMTLFPDTIYNLKKSCNLLVNYNPDHPINFYSKGSGNKNVKNSLALYDVVITYSKIIKRTLNEKYNISTEVLPFGYSHIKRNTCSVDKRRKIKFIGSFDAMRFQKLNSIKTFNLQIFGDDKWRKFESIVGKTHYFANKKVYGDCFIDEIQDSLAIINFLRQQNIVENSHNMRTFEVPALGGVLLSDFTDEQASFFEPDKEMLFFKNNEELEMKLELLVNTPKLIDEISKNAFLRSRKSNYSYNHRSIELIEIFKSYIS